MEKEAYNEGMLEGFLLVVPVSPVPIIPLICGLRLYLIAYFITARLVALEKPSNPTSLTSLLYTMEIQEPRPVDFHRHSA